MDHVKPKKSLGQHFLKDQNIANKIVKSLSDETTNPVLEIGPGMGVLTKYLIQQHHDNLHVIEIDKKAVEYLQETFPNLTNNIINKDFLKVDLDTLFIGPIRIIGNFPYNISSQIFFKILEHKNQITETICMIQKEVAERIVSPPGNKTYGILSVLLQCYFSIEKLFEVPPSVFYPPPKVQSTVVRLQRNSRKQAECNEKLLFRIVKACFNQRRKIIRNSLKSIFINLPSENEFYTSRPEQLSVEQFIQLTNDLEPYYKTS